MVRFLKAEKMSQSEIHRHVIKCLGPEKFQPKGSVCAMQQISKMAKRHRIMIQRNTEADQSPHTLLKIVSLSKV
jgi:hypothetical protein